MINKEVINALKVLKSGGLILYPTDTIWGIGCDATNYEAVERIYRLKKRAESKSMICLVNSTKMLKNHVRQVPSMAYDILHVANKPTTIIYDNPIGVSENLIAEDNTLAIRKVKDEFCNSLLQEFKKPIVSTSANISGEPAPKSFKEISDPILKGVDYIVNLQRKKIATKPSSIIKLSVDGKVQIIRE